MKKKVSSLHLSRNVVLADLVSSRCNWPDIFCSRSWLGLRNSACVPHLGLGQQESLALGGVSIQSSGRRCPGPVKLSEAAAV